MVGLRVLAGCAMAFPTTRPLVTTTFSRRKDNHHRDLFPFSGGEIYFWRSEFWTERSWEQRRRHISEGRRTFSLKGRHAVRFRAEHKANAMRSQAGDSAIFGASINPVSGQCDEVLKVNVCADNSRYLGTRVPANPFWHTRFDHVRRPRLHSRFAS